MRNILLVDGYNIIGDWVELRDLQKTDLEGARDQLIEKMAEYQAYTGTEVIIVFDAHMVPGLGKSYRNFSVEILYTREKETADERIEKLVTELKRVDTKIYVATSDFVEQRVIFASGAYRKSARELRTEVSQLEKKIASDVSRTKATKLRGGIPINDEVKKMFERMRRGK
ncbi:NYN domain-containing protein [Salisediminibacterium selenitireducens]|uniref:NYN domain-containing protein n=1 Tax=Bacillus selenitireducens (strain ATCC 700615 / DSM 15326 / MLS10) TaxID=439292 RepID=D6XV85_BACIE|nr:NYN domain-containing protein [Salisediminibacterium selenitireducens]ADH97643.1 protein of unknown function DUF901 [[Bacillus] selenitireducens MLS10]